MIEWFIYSIGAIVCFVLSFKGMARYFINEYPSGRIDTEETVLALILAVLAGMFWFVALPCYLLYFFCSRFLIPSGVKGSKSKPKPIKKRSWIRK